MNNNNNNNNNSNKQLLKNKNVSPNHLKNAGFNARVSKEDFLTELFLTSFWIQVLIRAVPSCISSYIPGQCRNLNMWQTLSGDHIWICSRLRQLLYE